MNVLIDANVLIDVALNRQPWVNAAQRLVDVHHQGKILGCVAATSVPTIFYLVRRGAGLAKAFASIDTILAGFCVLNVNDEILEAARTFSGNDFEDLVQLAAAVAHGADAVVTRDARGFAASTLPIDSPDALLAELARQGILPTP